MGASSKVGKGLQFLNEHDEEIKSALELASAMIEEYQDIHSNERAKEEQIKSEIGDNESQAEKDTAQAIKGLEEEEKNVGKGLKSLKKAIGLTEGVISSIGAEETELNNDIEELEELVSRLKNNPRDATVKDIMSLLDIIYTYISDEIRAEERTADLLFRISEDSEMLAEEEAATAKDLEVVERETEAETEVHKDSLLRKIHGKEKEEEDYLKKERSYLHEEFELENEELQELEREVEGTKKQARRLETVLGSLVNMLEAHDYGQVAQKVESVHQEISNELEGLENTEQEIRESINFIERGESKIS